MIDVKIGDCREVLKTIPDKSVNCVVTSPPYYGLRDYGTAKWVGGNPECDHVANPKATKKMGNPEFNENRPSREETKTAGYYQDICPKCGAVRVDKQIGLEQTPEEYVNNLVEVFREVKRVLRDDGTLWLNLGDSYWGGKGQSGSGNPEEQKARNEDGQSLNKAYHQIAGDKLTRPTDRKHQIIKPKDLIGIPWRVAFALQADGWYLRQDIIWQKNNPMPESVRDRCTKAHEYVFLLSKSQKYYYDNEAIKEECQQSTSSRYKYGFGGDKNKELRGEGIRVPMVGSREYSEKRNKRSVWQVNTKPYKGAHFATFPNALIEPCILAGTSEHGVCSECGVPFERVTEVIGQVKQKWGTTERPDCRPGNENGNGDKGIRTGMINVKNTVGWEPSCTCNASIVHATVLDPFGGSGTVGEVCIRYNRNAILIELNPEYEQLIRKRLSNVQSVLVM
jgi:DNA modification methylase